MWSNKVKILVFYLSCSISVCSTELWEQDLSEDMKIGVADSGFQKVHLNCGAESMTVDIQLTGDEEFEGIVYTRGSFHRKQLPCYVEPERGAKSVKLKFPLSKCQTLNEGEVYSNVIVVQHDKELIMPGDAAFNVECDFSKPRDITVNADLMNKKRKVTSRITLVDADPGAIKSRHKRSFVESEDDNVILTLEDVKNEQGQQPVTFENK